MATAAVVMAATAAARHDAASISQSSGASALDEVLAAVLGEGAAAAVKRAQLHEAGAPVRRPSEASLTASFGFGV